MCARPTTNTHYPWPTAPNTSNRKCGKTYVGFRHIVTCSVERVEPNWKFPLVDSKAHEHDKSESATLSSPRCQPNESINWNFQMGNIICRNGRILNSKLDEYYHLRFDQFPANFFLSAGFQFQFRSSVSKLPSNMLHFSENTSTSLAQIFTIIAC